MNFSPRKVDKAFSCALRRISHGKKKTEKKYAFYFHRIRYSFFTILSPLKYLSLFPYIIRTSATVDRLTSHYDRLYTENVREFYFSLLVLFPVPNNLRVSYNPMRIESVNETRQKNK